LKLTSFYPATYIAIRSLDAHRLLRGCRRNLLLTAAREKVFHFLFTSTSRWLVELSLLQSWVLLIKILHKSAIEREIMEKKYLL
jgi:hypothetical protein